MNWLENLRRSFLDWNAMAEVLPTMIAVGLKNTLILAAASTVFGVIIGMVLAIMGISRSPWLRIPARVYTDIFRGLPAIVTILLIGQGFARIGSRTVRTVALSAGHHGAQPDRGCLYRRDLPFGHPERRPRPDGSLPRAEHELWPGHEADRRAPGRAAGAAGAGQPVHRQRQGFEPCLLSRAAGLRARNLPRWTGPRRRHRQSFTASARRLFSISSSPCR